MFKPLIKDTFIYGFVDIFFRLMGFLTFPIFSRIFTAEEYGVLTLATTIPTFVVIFVGCGINNAVQRFYFENKYPDTTPKTIVTTGFVLSCLLAIPTTIACICLVYAYQDVLMNHFELEWELLAIGLLYNIPALLLQYCLDTIRLHFTPWKFSFLSLLQNVFSVFFPLILILYFGMGIKGFLVSSLISALLALPLGMWWIRKDLGLKINWSLGWHLLRYGYPFIFTTLAYWIFGGMDRLMLGEMSNNYEVGIYSTAFKFTIAQTFIVTAFARAWSPHLLKMYETDANFSEYCERIFIFWSYLQIILGCLVAMFSLEVLMLLSPEPYWKAAEVLTYISYGMIFFGTTQVTCIGIFLKKQTIRLSQAAWLAAIFNFILNVLLIPSYGAVGAAIGTAVANGVLTLTYFFFSQRLYPIKIDKNKLGISLGVFLGFVIFNYVIGHYQWRWEFLLLKTVVLGSAVYLGFASRIFAWEDLQYYFSIGWKKAFGNGSSLEELA